MAESRLAQGPRAGSVLLRAGPHRPWPGASGLATFGGLLLAAALTSLAVVPALAADPPALPEVAVEDPPAFGHQVGDVVERRLHLRLPSGARFDAGSLPPPSRQGAALELARVQHVGQADDTEQTVRLAYQIFRSPVQPTVLELPALSLRFSVPSGNSADPGRRTMSVRVDVHPLMVSPLAPAEPPQRRGLGPMQADAPAPLLPLDGLQARLAAGAGLAALGALWLAWRHALKPWWQRRQRPFAQAWREMRALLPAHGSSPSEAALSAATRRLHAALRADAGRVLLRADVPGWLARRPGYAPLAGALDEFFARSSERFFAPRAEGEPAPAGRSAQATTGLTDLSVEAAALRALSQALARAEDRQ